MNSKLELAAAGNKQAQTGALRVHLPESPLTAERRRAASVLLVGAGAVNLIAAWHLQRSGVEVHLVDARPDPLTDAPWKSMGSTFGGYGARIFSLTEARQHHRRDGSAVGASAFRRSLADGGWLCCPTDSLDRADWAWIDVHERLPGSLLRRYGEDIESFNVESDPLWDEMRLVAPELFRGVSLREPLLRTYPDDGALDRAATHETSISVPPRRISPGELRNAVPALAAAVDRGEIAGALQVRGFSIDVHAFGRKLIETLSRLGVAFHWNLRVDSILWSNDGGVAGLSSSAGPLKAQAYVLSPGAYSGDLLVGSRSEGKVAAIAGGWVSIPNAAPALEEPLKISRRGFGAPGPAEGANVVPVRDDAGRPWAHISSAHGFLGLRPDKLGGDNLHHLTEAARQTAQRYFPAAVAAAGDMLRSSERYCVRPWTATGLGLFETLPSHEGGVLVIATGHNTGGFAQSPATARAVLAALSGESHRMHILYHPDRVDLDLAAQTG